MGRGSGGLHVVIHQSVVGHLLVLRAGAAVVGVGVDADAAAGGEDAGDFDVAGIHEADEVFHDDVDAVLVEVAVVAEGEEVELERLAFDHALVGQVGDADLSEVGLSGDGAEAGEFGAVELHPVVVFGMLVLEGFQHFGSVVLTVFGLLAKGLKAFLFSLIHRIFFVSNFSNFLFSYFQILLQSLSAQFAGGAFAASVTWDAVVAGEGFVAYDVEDAKLVGELPGFGFVNPHQRGVDDELLVHGEVEGYVERADEGVAAVGIAGVVGLRDACDEVHDAVLACIDSGDGEEEEVAAWNEGVGRQYGSFGVLFP